jgi:RNA polymerase sigma-70 factor (ECF subfamily)
MALCIPDRRIDDRMKGKELGRLLEQFLATLPKDSRLIFLRRYLYLDTVAEIAKRYGFSESKVKMQLNRTRAKLHAYLNKEGITV